ncbi:hypothetical protein LOC68_21385 [Blastopirellula sp. JC732]|uniref:DUF2500 family protein n=1 Tax=Blastopirellula sediminis TaxID=2894196 RepID=A0A9X1MQB0_9BACT|nr:hypothetical protein [Blastopirellula sediminis]MCC9605749.1 hypothetical protein [Blastopirellula sediminis]MCC9630951.1 hypothetical protein [Blastopirellula sediminis]
MKCASCSADVAPHSLQCEYCGSYVEQESPSIGQRNVGLREQIFACIKNSPQFSDLAQNRRRKRPPNRQEEWRRVLSPVTYCYYFVAFLIYLAFAIGPYFVIPIAILAIVVILGLAMTAKLPPIPTAPKSLAQMSPAIVVNKRQEVRGRQKQVTCQFVTFEFEDGRRQELSVWDPGLFRQLANQEAGVLFRHGRVATDFRCVTLYRSLS